MQQIDPLEMAKALRSKQIAVPQGGGVVGSGQRGFNPNSAPTIQPQQGQSAISPAVAQPLMSKIMGGGGASSSANTLGANPAGWSEAAFGTGGTTGSAVGAAPASGSAAGGSSMGSMAASAGPWAALAAAVIGNEEHSRKKGLRAEDSSERLKDQLTGKVLTQDIEGKWGPYMDKLTGGKATSLGFTGDAKAGSQIASGRLGAGLKTFTKDGTMGSITDFFRKLF